MELVVTVLSGGTMMELVGLSAEWWNNDGTGGSWCWNWWHCVVNYVNFGTGSKMLGLLP